MNDFNSFNIKKLSEDNFYIKNVYKKIEFRDSLYCKLICLYFLLL